MGSIHQTKSSQGVVRFKKLRAILKSFKQGASIQAACKAAAIDTSTLWKWRKANERLDELIRNTIDSRIQVVEDALFKKALEGNTTAMIFFLTNRAPERWADRRALVQNNIYNGKGKTDGSFNGADAELQQRIREDFISFLP
jgi:transposase-like protein